MTLESETKTMTLEQFQEQITKTMNMRLQLAANNPAKTRELESECTLLKLNKELMEVEFKREDI